MAARITGIDDGALDADYGGLRTLAATYRTEAGRIAGYGGLGIEAMARLAPSVLLSPVTGAEAEKAVLEATAGLAEQAAGWSASALAVDASLAAYQAADGGAAELLGYGAGSWARIELQPGLRAGSWLVHHLPAGTPGLSPRTSGGGSWSGLAPLRSALEPLLQRAEWPLTHEPALTGQAVDLVSGFTDGASGRAPGAPGVPSAAATMASAYGPETGVRVTRLGSTRTTAPGSLAAAMTQLGDVSGADAPMPDGTIAITRIAPASGAGTGPAWIVDIPGTDDMNPLHALSGSTLRDMKENLRYVAGEPTAYTRGILAAMSRAGIRPGQPVLLAGHSQGGMAAQALAQSGSRYDIAEVVTAGAPDVPGSLPDNVGSIQLEHHGDLVPELDGHGPDASPQHLTVTFDSGIQGVVENHGFGDYDAGAAAVDASSDPRLAGQMATLRADGLLRGGAATTTVYQLSRR